MSTPLAHSRHVGEFQQSSIRMLGACFQHLLRQGLSLLPTLDEYGIETLHLLKVDMRISHEALLAVWGRAAALTADPMIAIHMVEKLEASELVRVNNDSPFVVVQLLLNSATVGEGLERFAAYYAPIADLDAQVRFAPTGETAYLSHALPGVDEHRRLVSEFTLALLRRLIRELTTPAVSPLLIEFAHAAPAEVSAYERSLGTRVRFGQPENRIVWASSDLRTPLRTANPVLLTQQLQRADELCTTLHSGRKLTGRARLLISKALAAGPSGADRVAEQLGVSVRTLSRNLRDEGTSYRQLLDAVRAELAEKYLIEDQRPAEEVAPLLGFSEPSALRRAFRRWRGATLGKVRRAGRMAG
jgi:AraC-like DNA-binding protein